MFLRAIVESHPEKNFQQKKNEAEKNLPSPKKGCGQEKDGADQKQKCGAEKKGAEQDKACQQLHLETYWRPFPGMVGEERLPA